MNLNHYTLAELERMAYARGDVTLTALVRRCENHAEILAEDMAHDLAEGIADYRDLGEENAGAK